jgi:glycyl-tRNA synthetase
MGIARERLSLRQHRDDERSFYSSDTWDVEYMSESFGRIELVGVADRTDYDLSAHAKLSGEDLAVTVDGRKFVPHVLEVAYGIDRPFWCVLESCLKEDERGAYFTFPKEVAPYVASVFPLVGKDGIEEKARELFNRLKNDGFFLLFDKSGSIGRRYARADEIGIPYCITVDYDTMADGTVTLRDRNSKSQERLDVEALTIRLRASA